MTFVHVYVQVHVFVHIFAHGDRHPLAAPRGGNGEPFGDMAPQDMDENETVKARDGRKSRESRPHRGEELSLTIDSLAQGGRGVGRDGGFVLFVPLTAPGDRVRALVKKTHKRWAEAEPIEILEESSDRVVPPCPYFGECGGCSWQHIRYSAQLAAKEAIVRESFERLAELAPDLPFRPIIPAKEELGYRNKMEFSFHPDSLLGLHRRGYFDQVVEVDRCLLPSPAVSKILELVKSFVKERGLRPWCIRGHTGLLRHLVIREGRGTAELMVGLVTSSDPFPGADELAERLSSAEPRIASILRAVTDSKADAVRVDSMEILHGRDHILEKLGGIDFEVGLETFFQTNTEQAERMVSIVKEMAEADGSERAIDLFCGVGTFALLLAPLVREVHGLEVVEASIESAIRTAKREGIGNAHFTVGDARRGLPLVIDALGAPPDLLVLDPPRSGAGGKVMRRIGRSGARRVIYVSCNPATLAPDLDWLVPFGYRIEAVQPIDLFPQTNHVETIVRLDRLPDADGRPDPFKK